MAKNTQGNSLRIIVSATNSPLYNLAYALHIIIKNSLPELFNHVKNSFCLVKKLNCQLDSSHKLASLEVVSLFTNVSIDMAIKCISKRWNLITNNTSIPQEEFLIVVRLVLNLFYL